MKTGSIILAPQGFRELMCDEQYYFLTGDGLGSGIRLIRFLEANGEIIAQVLTMPRLEFELALENGDLYEKIDHDKKPFWLESIAGVSIDYLEGCRTFNKISYDQRINNRYLAIAELVQRVDEILASSDPEKLINKYAKEQGANTTRLRSWFFTYVIFGFNRFSLMPRLFNSGGKGRDKDVGCVKLGRPSRKGKKSGFAVDLEMKEKIAQGYVACKSAHDSWDVIYGAVLTGFFGCVVSKGAKGKLEFRQPQGKPFPSKYQFKYWVGKSFNSKILRRDRIGELASRARTGSQGSFSDSLINLYQQVEFDGFYFAEKLSGVIEGSAVDGFCVVRSVCGLSGIVLGIGFAEGAENMEAYRMCLFSMAINKVKFCELFGVPIADSEWPCYGLPPNMVVDRGPARGYDIEPQVSWLGTIEMPPSYSGQSKAAIESSHPRKKKILSSPSHEHSNLNFVDMVKRQILTVIYDNKTSNSERRASEDMFEEGFTPTPNNIFNYYDARARNSSKDISFDDAVRRFLTPHAVKIKRDAVYFYGRKYRSEELIQTSIFDVVAQYVEIEATAYAITMCVRHVWLEYRGRIYELDAVLPSSAPQDGVNITLRDLMEIDNRRKLAIADLLDDIPVAQQDIRNRFEDITGKGWKSGKRKPGAPKKNASAKREADDFARFNGKKK